MKNRHSTYHPLKQVLLFIAVSFLTIVTSCEFEPHLRYDSGAIESEPELPEMTLNFSDSILVIYEKTQFNYAIDPGERDFLGIEVLVDNEIAYSSDNSKGSFQLDPKNGSHILTVQVYTNSGSGSVFDQLGGEGFVYSYSATLIREVALNRPVRILSTENTDGTLNITWERYSGHLFKDYQLYKISNGSEQLLATITDSLNTSFIDEGYVGGNARYFVNVERTDQRTSRGDTVLVSEIPEISISIDKNFYITVSWSRCNYDANFKNYELTRIENYMANHWSYSKIYTSEDVSDTSFTFSYGLDPESTFRVTYNSIIQNEDNGFCKRETRYYLGTEVDDEGFFTISQSSYEPYWLYTEDLKINALTFETYPYNPPEAYGVSLCIAPDNEYFISGRYLLDPADMSRMKLLTGFSENGSFPGNDSRVSISVKEKALYEFWWLGKCYFYDIKYDSIIREFGHRGLQRPTISPNGEYIITKHRDQEKIYIYEIDGTNITLAKSIIASSMHFTFLNDTLQSRFLAINGSNLELWSCDTRSLVQSVSTSAEQVLEYDPVSNTVLCSGALSTGGGLFQVYSIEPSLEQKNVFRPGEFDWNPQYYRDVISYVNSTLFVGNRYDFYAFNIPN